MAIAGDRERGASALVAELLPVLDEAIHEGRESTIDVARIVCAGQPAMAPLWNLCAAAVVEFDEPGRYLRRRAEVARAPRALVRAAVAGLRDALADEKPATVLTLSYSGSVARTLAALHPSTPIRVVCAESQPGGEGAALAAALRAAGLDAEVVQDALLTTYLSGAAAVVIGADAVAAPWWLNKSGTLGLCAAASVTGVPVYVVASRDKAAANALIKRLVYPRTFEQTPAHLATLFLTEVGVITPDRVALFCERYATDIAQLLDAL